VFQHQFAKWQNTTHDRLLVESNRQRERMVDILDTIHKDREVAVLWKNAVTILWPSPSSKRNNANLWNLQPFKDF
jgi:hypothetical protein